VLFDRLVVAATECKGEFGLALFVGELCEWELNAQEQRVSGPWPQWVVLEEWVQQGWLTELRAECQWCAGLYGKGRTKLELMLLEKGPVVVGCLFGPLKVEQRHCHRWRWLCENVGDQPDVLVGGDTVGM
jgi:hypothetical protein